MFFLRLLISVPAQPLWLAEQLATLRQLMGNTQLTEAAARECLDNTAWDLANALILFGQLKVCDDLL